MVANISTMPGIMIERPKMTRVMYQSLKRHIMKEREKIRQEQEQDEALERFRKEKELEKKKKEEDTLTLGQTKEQIGSLETKLESLKQEKHKLFSQLKKVLHQEDENRKRAQLKEHNEILNLQQQYAAAAGVSVGHPMFMQSHMQPRPKQYMNVQMHPTVVQSQGIKRQRSPSPPPAAAATIFPHTHYAGGKYPAVSYPNTTVKQEPHYTTQHKKAITYPVSSHASYSGQSAHGYQQPPTQSAPQAPPPQPTNTYPANQSPASKYAASSQSAFQSYSSHYAQHQQKPIPEHYQPGYPVTVTRVAQPGNMKAYISSTQHAGPGLPLQQQLEHANQKSGFSDDKFKMQQVKLRGMAPMNPQQPSIIQGQISSTQASSQPQPPPKGSIMSGYPVRTQVATSQIQAVTVPVSSHTSPGPPRMSYAGPGPERGRYY